MDKNGNCQEIQVGTFVQAECVETGNPRRGHVVAVFSRGFVHVQTKYGMSLCVNPLLILPNEDRPASVPDFSCRSLLPLS